ncbi:protein phosphatase 1 regulatory subunit 12C [Lates calcarifer]|uniref:Protein phosphatase 1 regulatory subunit 12C n=1 Tax=Lates calcarifer TaxID=8187 RepID=A0AAJ8B0V5_LATCA|nr:protein phosphatase 1 regulatory subunit 12C [Lates calcarifer]
MRLASFQMLRPARGERDRAMGQGAQGEETSSGQKEGTEDRGACCPCLCHLQSDDNDPSGEEEFSGSGPGSTGVCLCVFICVYLLVVTVNCNLRQQHNLLVCPLCLQTDQHLSTRSDVSCNDCTQGGESETKDFKKLFEEVSRENSQLQSQLQDTQRIVSQTRLDLEKATQRQERFSDCSALLELERKDRRMLERRMAELEEELKVLVDLRADNQRLKDENGALIRVISKLSK